MTASLYPSFWKHMWRIGSIGIGLAVPLTIAVAQTAEIKASRKLRMERDMERLPDPPGSTLPVLQCGKLISYLYNRTAAPVIRLADGPGVDDGKSMEFTFRIPEATEIDIVNIASSRSGEVAIVGRAVASDWRGVSFIARVSADRQSQVITRVHPYDPGAVAFAPDDTIWTLGYVTDEARTKDVAYHVLRRFDASGKVLSSRKLAIQGLYTGENLHILRGSLDRMGLYTDFGEYLEFSLRGEQIGRYKGPVAANGIRVARRSTSTYENILPSMAISDDNEVVVCASSQQFRPQCWVLKRIPGVWEPLAAEAGQLPQSIQSIGFIGHVLAVAHSTGLKGFAID